MTRRRVLLLIGLTLALSARASAVSYIGFEQITVAASSIGFTISKICPDSQSTTNCNGGRMATVAYCDLETAGIRYTIDGVTTPTSSVGHVWSSATSQSFYGADILQKFRAIRSSGSSGQLNCTYSVP